MKRLTADFLKSWFHAWSWTGMVKTTLNKPIRLRLAQLLCRYLPPIVAQSLRTLIYPRDFAYRDQYHFVTKAQTGSLFEGTTKDFHAYPFSVHGYLNWRNWALALALYKPGDWLLEIGGNIGTETVGFADITGADGMVMVFEPFPENIKSLENLCRLNSFKNVKVMPMAVGSYDGLASFIIPPDEHSSGVGYLSADQDDPEKLKRLNVECVQLDSIHLDNGRVSIIFIDAEGSEVEIIQGASKVIEKNRPSIVCEASPKLLTRAGSSSEELHRLISSFNYKIFAIGRLGLKRDEQDSNHKKADWLCLPNEIEHKVGLVNGIVMRSALMPCIPGFNPLTRIRSNEG